MRTQDNPTRKENTVTTAMPPVDVLENEDELLVIADLPGVKADALKLDMDRHELSLTAHREVQSGEGALRLEYARSFRLPSGVDRERVEATLKGGVLTLRLPKSAAVKPRAIPIKAS